MSEVMQTLARVKRLARAAELQRTPPAAADRQAMLIDRLAADLAALRRDHEELRRALGSLRRR
jgi:hypothetical protein